jgi:NADPH:quinone reductase-like Zn-dependent oxidoreductase
MNAQAPATTRRLHSMLDADGTVTIAVAAVVLPPLGEDQVLVRIEAAPINPSDIMILLAGADPATATFAAAGAEPSVIARVSEAAVRASSGRVGTPLALGLEGAGTVIAAGTQAEDLLGKRVAAMTMAGGTFGECCVFTRAECLVLPDGASARDGAGLFSNPLTALAIVETLHLGGQTAMVNTAAASNLGQMLVRICREDGIRLVNIVRRAEHVGLLRAIGAQYVCDASAPSFREDLLQALRETGATIAFDAIGGGTMASDLLFAMETVALERAEVFNPYGSFEAKRVYVYGRLDPGSIEVPPRPYGFVWGIDGWSAPPILSAAGAERAGALLARIAGSLTTTFASHYGGEISLADALRHEPMLQYCAKATGHKFLINPQL